MAEKSYFFNDINDDRVYLAEDFALFFSTLIGNGVFPNPSTNTQVLINEETSMTITIKPGFAWINGYLYWNPDNLVKTLATAYTNPRIDRVVIRWSSNNREIRTDVITGIPAASPVAPELTRNSDIWELAIADIWVGANVTMISQANITDLRLSNNLCGIVHGLFDQVDTTTLFNQYQAWFGEFSGDAEAEFNTFLAQLENALSGDVAGNLLNMINDLIARMTAAETAIGNHSTAINNHTADIAALDTRLELQERLLTSTIPTTGWSGTAPYTIAITVPGLTNSRPDINPILSATPDTARLEKEAWNTIGYIDCTANTMTVTCLEEIPTTAINVELVGG